MGEPALRWRDLPRVAVTLVAEIALGLGLWAAGPLLGRIPAGNLTGWLHQVSASEAVTAVARLAGMIAAAWLLISTIVYLAASLAGADGLVRRTRWVILPVVRRMIDGLAVASIAATSITAAAGRAGAALPPQSHPLVASPILANGSTGQATHGSPQRDRLASPARVNERITGRHLPHPGVVEHANLAAYTATSTSDPSGALAGLAPGTKYIVVQPGDCLSVLAQEHLGNWRLDTAISELNYGRSQPDGRALVDDHWIYPGWILVMPPQATGTLVVAAAASGAPHNASAPSSPAPAETIPTESPTTAAGRSSPAPTTTPTTARSATTVPATTLPPATTVPSVAPTHKTPAERATGSNAHPGDPPSHNRGGKERVPVGPVAAISGLVAAGVIWRLGRRRRDQMHLRPSGRRIKPNPTSVVAAELQARAIADTETMRWVDAGLRYLGGQLAARQTVGEDPRPAGDDAVVPSVVLVRAGARGLEVMVSPPCMSAPDGWTVTDEGSVWVLTGPADIDELEAQADGRWPFLPALATIGSTTDGPVLANLEHAGSLGVDGTPDLVQAFAEQMLMELTSQPWTEGTIDAVYALGDLGLGRLPGVTVVDDAMALAERLDRMAERTAASLGAAPSAAAVRACDASEALPQVAVALAGSSSEAVRCLIEAAVPDRSALTVIAVGPAEETRWRLSIDTDGAATLAGSAGDHPFALPLRVEARPDSVRPLGQALGAAADLPEEDTDLADEVAVLDRTDSGQGAGEAGNCTEAGEVEIRFLGRVDLVGGADLGGEVRLDAPLAVLAYLATRPGPVAINDLTAALWPPDSTKDHFGMPSSKTVYNVVARARSFVGVTEEGERRMRREDGGYVLDGSIRSDWSRFQALTRRARTGPGAEASVRYRKALELVSGRPFEGSLDSQFFEWVSAEQLDHAITAAVVDVAEELAGLALDSQDYESALWAVQRGLDMDPAREVLYQCWMHVVGRSEGPDRVAEVWRRLCSALHHHIDPSQGPSPESQAVYRHYVAREQASV